MKIQRKTVLELGEKLGIQEHKLTVPLGSKLLDVILLPQSIEAMFLVPEIETPGENYFYFYLPQNDQPIPDEYKYCTTLPLFIDKENGEVHTMIFTIFTKNN